MNVCQLEKFDDGQVVAAEQLAGAGLINSLKSKIKILGNGELTKKLEVMAHKFSKSAQQKIIGSGGKTQVVG